MKQLKDINGCDLYDHNFESAIKVVDSYLDELDINIRSDNLNEDLPSLLFLIAFSFKHFKDQNRWLENFHKSLELINALIKQNMIHLGFFGGLSDIAYSIEIINRQTGNYKNLLTKLNGAICNYAGSMLSNSSCDYRMSYYDAISGLSGVGYYMLCSRNVERSNPINQQISDYFVHSIDLRSIHEHELPNCFIAYDKQDRLLESRRLPTGHLNFGISHGIAGIFAYLVKSKSELRSSSSIDKTISFYLDIFNTFKIMDPLGYSIWPSMIDLSSFISQDIPETFLSKRISWCYGNISILRLLYLFYSNTNDTDNTNVILNELKHLANVSMDNYLLESPMVCHGYSGLLLIFNALLKETKDKVFLYKTNLLIEKILTYKSNNETNYFKNIEHTNGFLEGDPGIIISLLNALDYTNDAIKHLML